MTKLQKQVLDLVKEYEGHATAEEIFLFSKSKGIDISLASTYRILNKLADENNIRRVSNLKESEDVYDKYVYDHEHLVCSKCHKISDIVIEDLKSVLEEKTKVKIERYDLCISYVCKDCLKASKKASNKGGKK